MLCLLYLANVAHAQADWWKQAEGLLNQVGAQTQVQDDNRSSLPFSNQELSQAFQQALQLGAEQVVEQLGVENGFYNDPVAHIQVPDELTRAKVLLDKISMGAYVDDL